ncbi:unnamed protein product [Urochloa decumbens]|uniref:RING-type domain-containing protein n=1 Tax=Urochloa decumbens TaxID=240449 RepID=A0ABC8WZ59_9POAL
MSAGAELALKVAAVALVAALIAAAASAWARARDDGARRGTTAHNAERALALGAATVTTYERAAGALAQEGRADRCAICLSEYGGGGGELVRVVPACGRFFHAVCGVDGWLRKRGTCPLCRGGLGPLLQCPPMPWRDGGDARGRRSLA